MLVNSHLIIHRLNVGTIFIFYVWEKVYSPRYAIMNYVHNVKLKNWYLWNYIVKVAIKCRVYFVNSWMINNCKKFFILKRSNVTNA